MRHRRPGAAAGGIPDSEDARGSKDIREWAGTRASTAIRALATRADVPVSVAAPNDMASMDGTCIVSGTTISPCGAAVTGAGNITTADMAGGGIPGGGLVPL